MRETQTLHTNEAAKKIDVGTHTHIDIGQYRHSYNSMDNKHGLKIRVVNNIQTKHMSNTRMV